MDEQSWIARAKDGDKDAFSFLVSKYHSLLKTTVSYYVAKRFIEDVSQEIWVVVYQKLWQLDDNAKFAPWLKKLTYYQCVNYRKTLLRYRHEHYLSSEGWTILLEGVASDQLPVHDWLERKDLKKELAFVLDQLPGDYGLALRLRFIQEMTYSEISDVTEMPLSTVKWRIHQGKKLLKAKLLNRVKRKGKIEL